MSNLIKSNYICFDKGDRRIIDSDVRYNNFIPFMPVADHGTGNDSADCGTEGFREGIRIVNMDGLLEKEKEEAALKAESLLEEAKAQADEIINDAMTRAETIKQDAYEEGKKSGYAEGVKEGQDSCNQIKAELQDKILQLERDYEAHLSQLEPEFADILIALIQKITGIMLEDNREVILHLIDRAIKQEEKSNRFVIRVSKEDYLYLESETEKTAALMSGNASVEWKEDRSLLKNQCIIETDNKMIDCSLDVQLKRLADDLKLLSRLE